MQSCYQVSPSVLENH